MAEQISVGALVEVASSDSAGFETLPLQKQHPIKQDMYGKYDLYEMPGSDELKCQDKFYGSVTVGERGQVVIPADARNELGIQAGDKLLVMKHPMHEGLMIFKIEAVREFLDEFAAQVESLAAKSAEERNQS